MGAAALALHGLSPVLTEGKKKKKKGGRGNNSCQNCFKTVRVVAPTLFDVGSDAQETGISECPVGSQVVSAAFGMTNAACQIIASIAIDEGNPQSWEFTIRCPSGQTADDNVVAAICLS